MCNRRGMTVPESGVCSDARSPYGASRGHACSDLDAASRAGCRLATHGAGLPAATPRAVSAAARARAKTAWRALGKQQLAGWVRTAAPGAYCMASGSNLVRRMRRRGRSAMPWVRDQTLKYVPGSVFLLASFFRNDGHSAYQGAADPSTHLRPRVWRSRSTARGVDRIGAQGGGGPGAVRAGVGRRAASVGAAGPARPAARGAQRATPPAPPLARHSYLAGALIPHSRAPRGSGAAGLARRGAGGGALGAQPRAPGKPPWQPGASARACASGRGHCPSAAMSNSLHCAGSQP